MALPCRPIEIGQRAGGSGWRAERARTDCDGERARTYLALAAQWHKKAPDEVAALEARREAAECYVSLADAQASASVAAAHLERAIQSLRSIPGSTARIEELHRRLLATESESIAEMKRYEESVDISRSVQAARAHVAGIALQDAVLRLALIWRPQSVVQLRQAVIESAKTTPFLSFLPRTKVNRYGKVVAKRGSLLARTAEEREEALRQAVFELGTQQHAMIVATAIGPARVQIAEEHYVSARDMLPLVSASVFVPAGREDVFAAGLAAGFNGDFLVALHLLMPQVEHAVRVILEGVGAITSKIDDDGVQDERDLGYLLHIAEAKETFGEDLLVDMQGLLVECCGSNLRNLLAHGLLDPQECLGAASVYFWWLALHLVVRPLLAARASGEQPQGASAPMQHPGDA